MLTPSTQTDYIHAATAAKEPSDDDVEKFIASARDLLDSKGKPEWVEWAGERLMPETARREKEAEEREERERVQCEVEERAASFERRRTAVEDRFAAGDITAEKFNQELAAIYDEEDGTAEGERGPPASEDEDDAKGDGDTEPSFHEDDDQRDAKDAKTGDKPNDDELTDDERGSQTVDDDTESADDAEGEPEVGDTDEVAVTKATTMPRGRVTKRKDRGESEVEMREVDGQVSPIASLKVPRSKLTNNPTVRSLPGIQDPGRLRYRGQRRTLQEVRQRSPGMLLGREESRRSKAEGRARTRGEGRQGDHSNRLVIEKNSFER